MMLDRNSSSRLFLENFLKEQGIEASLAVIQVGNDPAASIYVRNKKRACEYIGIRSISYELDENISEDELLALIDTLNNCESSLRASIFGIVSPVSHRDTA